AKHARATRADVVLDVQGGSVRLVVEDNGVGFDMARDLGLELRDARPLLPDEAQSGAVIACPEPERGAAAASAGHERPLARRGGTG
ncbi:MAG TPA: hypothetical protein VNI78_11600, partial [Vicinamibacterales bacterium]|nr:hypothetical protein [Vicinamibacterales bacterium]